MLCIGLADHSAKRKIEYKNLKKREIQGIFIKTNQIKHKDLPRRAVSDVICNEACNIAKNPKYDEYQHGLASMVYNFFNKKTNKYKQRTK